MHEAISHAIFELNINSNNADENKILSTRISKICMSHLTDITEALESNVSAYFMKKCI